MNKQIQSDMIVGRNPVLEAIKAGRPINKIFILRGEREGTARVIEAMAMERGFVVQHVAKAKLDGLTGGGTHQGVIAMASSKQYSDVEDIFNIAKERNEPEFIVILDEVEDPHNLGSIIRSCEAVGVHGVIIPKRRSAALTPIVGKSSAGAIEYIAVARVPNLSETMKQLKKRGVWIIGADAGGGIPFTECDMKGSIALVVGGEGKGLGRLVRETCDFVVNLPMKGKIESLNASVAAGVMLYEALRQRMA